jgi:hypothetical protein
MTKTEKELEQMKAMMENDFQEFLTFNNAYKLADIVFDCVNLDTYYKIINAVNDNM